MSNSRRERLDGEPVDNPENKKDEKITGESESSSRRNSLNALEESEEPGARKDEKGERLAEIDEEDITCPITKQIFLDAFTIYPMGITIERELAEYLLRNNLSYPQLNGEPKITAIAVNRVANNFVEKYLKSHPDAKSQQYVNGTYQTLLPKITEINKLQPGAPVNQAPAPAKPSFFSGLMQALRGDKKEDDAPRRGPGQRNG